MKFYLYLNASGSSHTLSDFVVVDPPELRNLKGSWECALVELSMECNITPKSDRIYLCGDCLGVCFVNQDRIQPLRNNRQSKIQKLPHRTPLGPHLPTSAPKI